MGYVCQICGQAIASLDWRRDVSVCRRTRVSHCPLTPCCVVGALPLFELRAGLLLNQETLGAHFSECDNDDDDEGYVDTDGGRQCFFCHLYC